MRPAWVVVAAAVSGLMFAPVFGAPALVLAAGVPAAVLIAVAALLSGKAWLRLIPQRGATNRLRGVVGSRHRSPAPWRPLLLAVAGLLAVVETTLWSTTVVGLPTGETLRALALGVTDSWQLALQSTWPARADAELLLFVPLLVVAASVLGIELLERLRSPLAALLPSLGVVVFAQLYATVSGWAAALAALSYAAAAGALLAATRHDPVRGEQGGRRLAATLPPPAGSAAVAVVCAVVAGVLAPSPPPGYTLKDDRFAPVSDVRATSPLDEIVYRLTHPDVTVFRVRGSDTGRWPVVVLTEFDGVNWSPGGQYRRLGTGLQPSPAVTVPVHRRTAGIEPADLGGPWLPSQTWPAEVRGADPLVEQDQGSLLVPDSDAVGEYLLTWWEPEISAGALRGAEIDPAAPGGLSGTGPVPDGIAELAGQAVHGLRPTFDAALELERYFRDNYQLATGEDPPTGHSWPQLTQFLLRTKRGTSEQFAAAYVALARITGVPARLVVGYRADESVVDGPRVIRNDDVLAWPEVAVKGVGWVPLDPTGSAAASGGAAGDGLEVATAEARDRLPASQDLRDPPVAPGEQGGAGESEEDSGLVPVWLLLGVPAGLAVLWLGGIPAAAALRMSRRKRRGGAGAVIGAWEEVRDRLRAHGVAVSAGMTVRDLATAASRIADESTVDRVRGLGAAVDVVLWSGAPADQDSGVGAWVVVRDVRRGLARRGLRARLRAALDPRPLRPPR